jgi:hypothetical protein
LAANFSCFGGWTHGVLKAAKIRDARFCVLVVGLSGSKLFFGGSDGCGALKYWSELAGGWAFCSSQISLHIDFA